MSKEKTEHKKTPAGPEPAEQPSAAATPEVPSVDTELDATKDRLLRLQADFDNFRRRTQREKGEWIVGANENILSELLPVIDHYELGLKNSIEHKTEKGVHDGFQMVYDQFLNTLKKFGMVPLDAHESGFDPTHHEAVAHIPSEEYPADEIIAQTRRGWKLGDKLLRPVQVVVSSGPGAPRDDEISGGGDVLSPKINSGGEVPAQDAKKAGA